MFEEAEKVRTWDETFPADIREYSKAIVRLHDFGGHYVPVELYSKVEALSPEEKRFIF